MSARAIQRLRQERQEKESILIPAGVAEEESDEEEVEPPRRAAAAFAMMDSSDDDSSTSNDSESEVSCDGSSSKGAITEEQQEKEQLSSDKDEEEITKSNSEEVGSNDEVELDALLAEFTEQDRKPAASETKPLGQSTFMDAILLDMDIRDLDIEYVMRTSLLDLNQAEATVPRRKNRQALLFGATREGWVRPPHYVGGGIGMTSYDAENLTVPKPYCDQEDMANDPKRWFTFIHSDSYTRDREDFQRVQQTGDLNALAMFVAHHPFVTDALVHFAMSLYTTNRSHDGLAILRRALWIYERSSLSSFLRVGEDLCFMDHDRTENEVYFQALFRLVKVAHSSGLMRSSLATSRYILSLDPLRDPKGVLLALDYFALATNMVLHDKWLVEWVEREETHSVYYLDPSSGEEYWCRLCDLPNWAYSYALALFRLCRSNPSEELEAKSTEAIQAAILSHPSVLGMLLQENEVDVTGRSFQTDWPSVLDYITHLSSDETWAARLDPVLRHGTDQALEVVMGIFVKLNHALWNGDDVLRWLYENAVELQTNHAIANKAPSPALMRYANCDPSDFDGRIRVLPDELNILDPNVVAYAMVMQPNRPRLLQGGMMRQGEGMEAMANGANQNHGNLLLGAPTQVVDPDWPMMEVFWRSMLPWNRVEGVPRPRR